MEAELKIEDSKGTGNRGKKIHPYKFTLWVAIGSIIMMFAGLTSAFIVRSHQGSWSNIIIPKIFWISTAVMLMSSITVQWALRSFKQRDKTAYRRLMGITLLLGITFVVLQWTGFMQLWDAHIRFKGSGSGQFLYVIFGLHALHVIGGILAMTIMTLRSFFGKVKVFTSVPVEVMATYWHFVDFLWLYLFIFFMVIQ
jgi:cytochrome c oxidase subunit III